MSHMKRSASNVIPTCRSDHGCTCAPGLGQRLLPTTTCTQNSGIPQQGNILPHQEGKALAEALALEVFR